jgi:hypothetical protein
VLGWAQAQARTWDGICRHTALAALAQLRAAIRSALTGSIALPAAPGGTGHDSGSTSSDDQISDADLQIPLGDAPVPARLAVRRLASLAAHDTAGLITRARLAFTLRWSLRRRRHQAIARWHHYSARLLAVTGTG